MANKNRPFPTEINRSFVYLDQILFPCNIGFRNVFLIIRLSVPETLP